MSNADRILQTIRASSVSLDDDELSRRSGVVPRQQVNQICRRLADAGLLSRVSGPEGKIVNALKQRRDEAEGATTADQEEVLPAGNSREQRLAERVMLDVLGGRLGVQLQPARVADPDGRVAEVDGADPKGRFMVECWAHQGQAKGGQKYKLVNDASKLWWAARVLPRSPERLIICVSDEVAIRHLRGRSWQAAAIRAMGVDLEVVELPVGWSDRIKAAQKRQFR